jgi:L-alanine-DL-glutamate epimerase-like enolase superfamily enzyme
MHISYSKYLLQFRHAFGISSNVRENTQTIYVKITSNGIDGYGEACLPPYLGESVEDTMFFFERAASVLEMFESTTEITNILEMTDRVSAQNNAGKAAIDMALHDLYGKQAGKPCYDLLDIGKSEATSTSFTIGIDKTDVLAQKIKEAADYKILKIKAGTRDDKSLIRQIRKHTDKPLIVDVNQGWKDKNQVLDMIFWMKDQGVIMVEQPMPVDRKEEMIWVTGQSPIPTIADESVKRFKDLEKMKGSFSGINIKLMKCTGLNEALKMISYAKEHEIKVMLGCMAESSCGTSAMAQLMKLADHVDLDAPLLYTNDPFKGVKYQDGKVLLNDLPGIGVQPPADIFAS